MKKSLASLLIIAPLVMPLTGCVIAVGETDYDHTDSYEDRETRNRSEIAQLKANMPYNEVKNRLGVPDFTESFQHNNEQVQVLLYRTNRKHKDGLTSRDECSKLLFKNDLLVSWGEDLDFLVSHL